jgi:hypothetical protein
MSAQRAVKATEVKPGFVAGSRWQFICELRGTSSVCFMYAGKSTSNYLTRQLIEAVFFNKTKTDYGISSEIGERQINQREPQFEREKTCRLSLSQFTLHGSRFVFLIKVSQLRLRNQESWVDKWDCKVRNDKVEDVFVLN